MGLFAIGQRWRLRGATGKSLVISSVDDGYVVLVGYGVGHHPIRATAGWLLNYEELLVQTEEEAAFYVLQGIRAVVDSTATNG